MARSARTVASQLALRDRSSSYDRLLHHPVVHRERWVAPGGRSPLELRRHPGNSFSPSDPSAWPRRSRCREPAGVGRVERRSCPRGDASSDSVSGRDSASPRRGHRLHYMQRRQEWSTDTSRVAVPPIRTTEIHIGNGPDLAVVVSIAADASVDVARYLTESGAPVADLVSLPPAEGAHDQVVGGPGQADAYAMFRQAVQRR